jgi:hypothetical protein
MWEPFWRIRSKRFSKARLTCAALAMARKNATSELLCANVVQTFNC